MDSIVGIMKKVAEQEVRRIYTTELGIVTALFPHKAENDKNNYQCSIKLKNKKQPDGSDFELRQVPVATPHMGMVNLPNIDDLVLVTFVGGDLNAPVIIGRLYNDKDQPPIAEAKEVLLQHSLEAGSSLKIDEEGTLTLTSKDEKSIVTVTDKTVDVTNESCALTLEDNALTAKNKQCEVSLKDGDLTAKNSQCEISLKGGDLTAKNTQCEISLKGGTATVSNGLCKIIIAGGGITLDAGSSSVTVKSFGSIKIGDATTSSIQVGGRMPGNAVADSDDVLLTTHTHVGNMGAPCPIMVPTEKINSIQAKIRNTKVG